jgi:hypothetical protein
VAFIDRVFILIYGKVSVTFESVIIFCFLHVTMICGVLTQTNSVALSPRANYTDCIDTFLIFE